MKLYVVLVGIDYEAFDTFMGAYSTRELAEARLGEVSGWDSSRIIEIALDIPHNAL